MPDPSIAASLFVNGIGGLEDDCFVTRNPCESVMNNPVEVGATFDEE